MEGLSADFDMDDEVTCEFVAETLGARLSLVRRLAQHGLIETSGPITEDLRLSRRAIIQLRRMQRLRRDLGVNFAGAAIILDLVSRIEHLNRELARHADLNVDDDF
jgi:chaperone modulatory protein CbpM